jgi:hypothetical protein
MPNADSLLSQSVVGGGSSTKLSKERRQEALQAQAVAPLKQVAMLCFMMWMSGSTLHLFSIMTTLSGIYQPLSGEMKLPSAHVLGPMHWVWRRQAERQLAYVNAALVQ